MPKQKNGINKSEEIRQVFKAHPRMKAKDVVATLADKGITVTDTHVYYVKGRLRGRKGRRRQMRQMADKVAATTGNTDALATVLRVKRLASEVGGMKKLKALVDAMTE